MSINNIIYPPEEGDKLYDLYCDNLYATNAPTVPNSVTNSIDPVIQTNKILVGVNSGLSCRQSPITADLAGLLTATTINATNANINTLNANQITSTGVLAINAGTAINGNLACSGVITAQNFLIQEIINPGTLILANFQTDTATITNLTSSSIICPNIQSTAITSTGTLQLPASFCPNLNATILTATTLNTSSINSATQINLTAPRVQTTELNVGKIMLGNTSVELNGGVTATKFKFPLDQGTNGQVLQMLDAVNGYSGWVTPAQQQALPIYTANISPIVIQNNFGYTPITLFTTTIPTGQYLFTVSLNLEPSGGDNSLISFVIRDTLNNNLPMLQSNYPYQIRINNSLNDFKSITFSYVANITDSSWRVACDNSGSLNNISILGGLMIIQKVIVL